MNPLAFLGVKFGASATAIMLAFQGAPVHENKEMRTSEVFLHRAVAGRNAIVDLISRDGKFEQVDVVFLSRGSVPDLDLWPFEGEAEDEGVREQTFKDIGAALEKFYGLPREVACDKGAFKCELDWRAEGVEIRFRTSTSFGNELEFYSSDIKDPAAELSPAP